MAKFGKKVAACIPLQNGGFETGVLPPWEGTAGCPDPEILEDGAEGNYYCHCEGSGIAGMATIAGIYQEFTCDPRGKPLSFYARGDTPYGNVVVWIRSVEGEYWEYYHSFPNLTSSWQQFSDTITAGSQAVTTFGIYVFFWQPDEPPWGVLDIDSVVIEF